MLAREQKTDPTSFRGSFAGAIGLPQFMPGSIRRWAVDFDGDGRIDLLGSPADAIGSVANFLAAHGWQRGQPILFEVESDEATVDALGRGIDASTSWSSALAAGVVGDLPLALDTPVLLIDLPIVGADGESRPALSDRHREFQRDPALQPQLLLRRGSHRVRSRAAPTTTRRRRRSLIDATPHPAGARAARR